MEESGCPLCLQDFNTGTRVPRVLPCGHSICTQCIPMILTKPLKYTCPIDQKQSDCPHGVKADYFPVNYALKSLLDEKSSFEICRAHGERKELICLREQVMVCRECAFDDGEHVGHKILTAKKAKQTAKERMEECKKSLSNAKDWEEKFKKSLDEEKNMLSSVNEIFKKIREAVEAKEKQITTQIQQFFVEQKKEMETNIGAGSTVVKKIEKEIKKIEEILGGKNLIQVVKLTSESIPQCNENYLQKHLKDLNQKLGRFTEFAKLEKLVIEPLNSFDFKFNPDLLSNSNIDSSLNFDLSILSQNNNNSKKLSNTIFNQINDPLEDFDDTFRFLNSSVSSQKSFKIL